MALDKSKPYGIVSGDDQGRAFEQDGVFYLGNGEPWEAPADAGEDAAPAAAAKPKGGKKATAAEPATPVDAELAAQMGQA